MRRSEDLRIFINGSIDFQTAMMYQRHYKLVKVVSLLYGNNGLPHTHIPL